MTPIKRYIIFLCIGILGGLLFAANKVEPLLIKRPTPPVTQIDHKLLTVKNCAPENVFHGETWLGNDLLDGLKTIYTKARQIYRQDTVPEESYINIYLRGYEQYTPPFPDNRHINIAYIIYPLYFSHADKKKIKLRHRLQPADIGYPHALFDELQFYDAIAVGSKSYAEKMQKSGFNAYYVPQFTNPKRFYPEYDENIKSEVLFVGKNVPYRTAAPIVLKAGLPITIYGPDWQGLATAESILNDDLHRYYSSAKIVLNDHRQEMKDAGFISNRLFDATASGTLVISDYMKEIEEIYGDSVPMWKTEAELIELVKYYLAPEHEDERLDKAHRAREITLKHFTANIVAKKFKQIISETEKNKSFYPIRKLVYFYKQLFNI